MTARSTAHSAQAKADLALARRCATERAAQEELCALYTQPIYRLASRLLGGPIDAEDLLQEVLLEVLGSIHSYRAEASLKSWIYQIVVHRALRRRRRPPVARLEIIEGGFVEGARDGLDLLDSRAALRRIEALLQRLSPDRRAIFVLHEVEGYSLPEAAALLGISVTAAKKRAWRARRELDALMADDPELAPRIGGTGTGDG